MNNCNFPYLMSVPTCIAQFCVYKECSFYHHFCIGRNFIYKSYCGITHIRYAFQHFNFFKILTGFIFFVVFFFFLFMTAFFFAFFVMFFCFFIGLYKNVELSIGVYNGIIGYSGRCHIIKTYNSCDVHPIN